MKKKSKPYLDLCLDRLEKRLKKGQTTPHLPSLSGPLSENKSVICINLHLAASQKPLAHFVAGKQPMLNLQVVKRKWQRQGGIARVKSFFRLASHAGVFRGAPSSQTPAQPKTTLLSHCFICLVSDQPINICAIKC